MSPIQSWFLLKTAKDIVGRPYAQLPKPSVTSRDAEQITDSIIIGLFVAISIAITIVIFCIAFS